MGLESAHSRKYLHAIVDGGGGGARSQFVHNRLFEVYTGRMQFECFGISAWLHGVDGARNTAKING